MTVRRPRAPRRRSRQALIGARVEFERVDAGVGRRARILVRRESGEPLALDIRAQVQRAERGAQLPRQPRLAGARQTAGDHDARRGVARRGRPGEVSRRVGNDRCARHPLSLAARRMPPPWRAPAHDRLVVGQQGSAKSPGAATRPAARHAAGRAAALREIHGQDATSFDTSMKRSAGSNSMPSNGVSVRPSARRCRSAGRRGTRARGPRRVSLPINAARRP